MKALVLVDIQNDFMPDGALPVPNGYEVIPVANSVQERFDLIVATQDWHPENHGSEPGEVIDLDGLDQVLWPVHCVQGSTGAEFVESLDTNRVAGVFRKGMNTRVDSYSGFHDNGHRRSTGLAGYLRELGVEQVYVLGVATDYCVKFTALDARREGFETFLIEDGCRGVELAEGDVARAIDAMKDAGVKVIDSASL